MRSSELDALSAALEHNSEALRALADALPHMLFTADRRGDMRFFNQRWIAYTGMTLDDTPANGKSSVIHPDDRDAMWARWTQCVKNGTPFEIEYRLRSVEDGSYRWFLTRAVPVRKPGGGVRMWIGTATDIDSQKRANENLNFIIDSASVFTSVANTQQIADEFARLSVQRFADWCVVIIKDLHGKYQIASLEHRSAELRQQIQEFSEKCPVSQDDAFTAILERRAPVLYSDISDEMLVASARDDEHLKILRDLGMRSAIIAPLVSEDELFGGIVMYTADSRRPFEPGDLEVVHVLAERAAGAIARRRAVSQEQRIKRRLQFVGQATQAIYESLDLGTTFSSLTDLIAGSVADFAVAIRLESDGAARVIAAAHKDLDQRGLTDSFVGVRPFHPQAEREFLTAISKRETISVNNISPRRFAEKVWPYLSADILTLAPTGAVTVPLHSRGNVYGAIVAYQSETSKSFSEDETAALTEIGRHASVAMENAEVFNRERRIAETLQDSLLPPSMPAIEGLRFDAVYLPGASGAQVGGDWYDAFVLGDGRVVVSTGDVTGRGPDAAVIMGKVRHLIAIAPLYEDDPAHILDNVESVLARRYPDKIVTAFLGIIDPDHLRMRFANAGHPPPLLRKADDVFELRAEGLPIGLRLASGPSKAEEVDLTGARMLVFYTDGLTEATHDVIAGEQRLYDVVRSNAVLHTHSPARFIETSCLPKGADDDVAVLTISFEPGLRWSFDAENARAAQDARGEFVRYIRANTSDEEQIAMAELVFGELVGNVVRHATGPIDVDLEWSGEYPALHVIDRGAEFAGTNNPLPEDVLSEGGRGLFIVRSLTRDFSIEHVAGYGNHVTAELPVRKITAH